MEVPDIAFGKVVKNFAGRFADFSDAAEQWLSFSWCFSFFFLSGIKGIGSTGRILNL